MLKLVIALALVAFVSADIKAGRPADGSFSASKESVDCCPAAVATFAKDGLKCGDSCYNADSSACWSGETKNTASDQSGSNTVVCAKNGQIACGHFICSGNSRTKVATSFGDGPTQACHADSGSCFLSGSTTKLSGGSTDGELWCTSGTAKRCGLMCLPASGARCIKADFTVADTDASVDSIMCATAQKRCGSTCFAATETCWSGLTKNEHAAVSGEGIAGDLVCPKDYLRCGGKVTCQGVIAGVTPSTVSSNAGPANWCFKSDNAKCFTSASDTAGQTTSSNADDAFACLNTQKRCGGMCIGSSDTCTTVAGLQVKTVNNDVVCGEEVINTSGSNLSCQDGKVCYPNQGVSTCRCRDPIAKRDCGGLTACGCSADGSSASTAAASGIAAILAAAGAMMN